MRIFGETADRIDFVQIYGERNSGTTYLSQLLQDNMPEPQHLLGLPGSPEHPFGTKIFGYKHWFLNWKNFADHRQARTLFVVIYRNPYTWVRAMMDRPYALERSIGGKPLADLPGVKLQGHINGRDTTNEFDPVTGEAITLFELRRKKIGHFETLRSHVDHVAYVQLEEFLQDPGAVIRNLATAFPGAFRAELDLSREPFNRLMEEFRNPKEFDPEETETLNTHLHWPTEAAIGYQKGHYGLAPDHRNAIVVLHGGSGVGKTHIMNALTTRHPEIIGLEMDEAAYWTEDAQRFDPAMLKALVPNARAGEIAAFIAMMARVSEKTDPCVAHLLQQIAALNLHQQDDTTPPKIVLATCGALPAPPAHKTAASLYTWLSERLPLRFHHVLIDPPKDIHLEQIARRGRSDLAAAILDLHDKKRANAGAYDVIATDLEDVDSHLATLGAPPMVDAPESPPVLRIYRSGLRYIQIYGERNSGTKYLTQRVMENARDPGCVMGSYATRKDPVNRARLIGYKHYYPRPERVAKHQHETLFLVIYKNPYTWVRSMLAKPYHFKPQFEGKSIADLPGIRLNGLDIHGNPIPDVHPETGERITLFELRRHKILQWEALREKVSNVVYVNYEHLLLRPTEVMQQIVEAFPPLFANPRALPHTPDERYLQKYISPAPFEPEEMAVMDAQFDWLAETMAGYTKGNLFVPD